MQVQAQLRRLRISPRKVRLVSGVLNGLDVIRAKHQLRAIVKKSSHPMSKLLNSAVANATNNFDLQESNLFIKEIIVNEGTKLKRGLPKGFGRISPIEKKTSHIKIVLEEKVPGLRVAKSDKKDKLEREKPEIVEDVENTVQMTKDSDYKKKEIRPSNKDKSLTSRITGIGKRFFRRKTG